MLIESESDKGMLFFCLVKNMSLFDHSFEPLFAQMAAAWVSW